MHLCVTECAVGVCGVCVCMFGVCVYSAMHCMHNEQFQIKTFQNDAKHIGVDRRGAGGMPTNMLLTVCVCVCVYICIRQAETTKRYHPIRETLGELRESRLKLLPSQPLPLQFAFPTIL